MTTIEWDIPGWYARDKKRDVYILIYPGSYAWNRVRAIMKKRKGLENARFINYECEWEFVVGIRDAFKEANDRKDRQGQ